MNCDFEILNLIVDSTYFGRRLSSYEIKFHMKLSGRVTVTVLFTCLLCLTTLTLGGFFKRLFTMNHILDTKLPRGINLENFISIISVVTPFCTDKLKACILRSILQSFKL